MVFDLDKEGGTGSSADPYVLLKPHTVGSSAGNHLRNIILEGSTSPNKSMMVLDGVANLVLENYWSEPVSTDGYGLRIRNSDTVEIRQNYFIPYTTNNRIKIEKTVEVVFSVYDTNGEDRALTDTLEVDNWSHVSIRELRTRRNADAFRIDAHARNITVDHSLNQTVLNESSPGYVPTSTLQLHGSNWLVNPSFDAGMYAWNSSNGPTIAVVPSAVAPGLALHLRWSSVTTDVIYQIVTITAAQVGKPLTFTALVNAIAGNSWVCPFISGAGLEERTGYNRAHAGSGWQAITQTIVPQAAGNLYIGFYSINLSELMLDECSLSSGTVAVPNTGAFGSLELGLRTFVVAAYAPTYGIWKQGDRVFNGTPAVGQPKSWVCVEGGTPGTWVSEGNL